MQPHRKNHIYLPAAQERIPATIPALSCLPYSVSAICWLVGAYRTTRKSYKRPRGGFSARFSRQRGENKRRATLHVDGKALKRYLRSNYFPCVYRPLNMKKFIAEL